MKAWDGDDTIITEKVFLIPMRQGLAVVERFTSQIIVQDVPSAIIRQDQLLTRYFLADEVDKCLDIMNCVMSLSDFVVVDADLNTTRQDA